MPSPTITAVIPTYRRPKLLQRAVESVLAQTYPHVKVFVSDNASGDETADVVRELSRRDPRVVYHSQPENIGATANFQYGMNAVDTEYFSLLSDDDFLLPDFYRTAVEALGRHPEARFFCGQVVRYEELLGTHSLFPTRHWSEGLQPAGRRARLMIEQHFVWTACVFHSGILPQVGPLDSIHMGDILFLGKAAACFPFVVSLLPVAVFLETGVNASANMSIADLRRCHEVMERRSGELPNITEEERQEIHGILEWKIGVAANAMLRNALEAGDWRRFEETAAFFQERGGLDFRRKLRVALARRRGPGSLLFRLVGQLTRLSTGYKRMRKSRWRKLGLEDVVAFYSREGR